MTRSQRAALVEMTSAILKCDCASPEMRARASNLRLRLSLGAVLGGIFA